MISIYNYQSFLYLFNKNLEFLSILKIMNNKLISYLLNNKKYHLIYVTYIKF